MSRPRLFLRKNPPIPSLLELAQRDPEVALFLQFVAQHDLRKEAQTLLEQELHWRKQLRRDQNLRIVGLRIVPTES